MALTLFAELGFGAVQLMLGARLADQHPGPPRPADEEHLRLLPRLADLSRHPAPAAAGPGRGARRRRAPEADGAGSPGPCTCDRTTVHGAARSRCASRSSAASPSPSSRSSSSASGPAGALRRQVPGRGEQQPHPRVQSDRPARRHPRPRRQRPGRQPHQPGAAAQHAETARRPARAAAELARLGELARHVAETDAADDPRVRRSRRRGAGDPAPRRRLRPRLLPGREPAALPRRLGPARLRPPLPARHQRRPPGRQRRRGLRRRAERSAVQGPRGGRRGRQGRGRVHLRPLPARDPGADQGPGQRARPADSGRAAGLAAADPRRQPEADDRPRRPGGRRKRRWPRAGFRAPSSR